MLDIVIQQLHYTIVVVKELATGLVCRGIYQRLFIISAYMPLVSE